MSRRGLAGLLIVFASACKGYKQVGVRLEEEVSPMRVGTQYQAVATLMQNEVHFPFASTLHVLYDSQHRPEAFRWSSSDTTVALVNRTGLVSARAPGQVHIRAETAGLTGGLTLWVTEAADYSIPAP